jgi:hypothetical protein
LAPKPIRKEAGTVGIPSNVVKAANPLRIKSVNGVFALTFTPLSRWKTSVYPAYPSIAGAPLSYRALNCDRSLVTTTFWKLFAPFHRDTPDITAKR